ncbi:MAG: diguanylate cyclase (GGDEF)-like protein/PAS domain S-box-containing protein [Gammaproteobacteria bacterium]|jgi:diguanylate cyclase (GGDEF)-like protein/PAS domain S-box-containing protein
MVEDRTTESSTQDVPKDPYVRESNHERSDPLKLLNMRAGESWTEYLVDNMSDSIFLANERGEIRYINSAAETLIGTTLAEIEGTMLGESIVFPLDLSLLPEVDLLLYVAVHGQPRTGSSIQVKTRCGAQTAIDYNVIPLRDTAGALAGAALIAREPLTQVGSLNRPEAHEHIDGLTQLPNRTGAVNALTDLARDLDKHVDPHTVMLVDLHGIDMIEDSCGHLARDQLMLRLVSWLRIVLGDEVYLARVGDCSFLAVFQGSDIAQTTSIVEQCLDHLVMFRFTWMEQVFNVSSSIGVCEFGNGFLSAEKIMLTARIASQIAKEEGSDRIHVLAGKDSKLVRRREDLTWVPRLNEALELGHFELYAQEVCPLSIGLEQTRWVEILARLPSAQGLVLPGEFLPAAERYGLSRAVDYEIVTQLFRFASRAPDAFEAVDRWLINVSAQTIVDPLLPGRIADLSAQYGVDLNRIAFEISETTLIVNLSNAIFNINKLVMRGVSFALDDFGAGYSSFAHLQSLPVDVVKIDGAFVRNIDHSITDRALVTAMNDVAQRTGKLTVAEFVENEAVLAQLRVIGVDYAQGFHIREPVPIDSLFNVGNWSK